MSQSIGPEVLTLMVTKDLAQVFSFASHMARNFCISTRITMQHILQIKILIRPHPRIATSSQAHWPVGQLICLAKKRT